MTNKVKRSIDNTRPVEERIEEFRRGATAIIQSTPAVLLVAVDPKNPEHGIVSGGIGEREKLLEILAASLMEDGQFRKLFEEAYRIATFAMRAEEAAEEAEEAEAEREREEDSVVVPFRVPTTKNLQ